jgi:hypothetical protein
MHPPKGVTQLLEKWSNGDQTALDELKVMSLESRVWSRKYAFLTPDSGL